MNAHKTIKTGESYPKCKQINCKKKILLPGTYFPAARITNQELQAKSKRKQQGKANYLEAIMDAKWNNVVDNTAVRIGMVVIGFGAWFALGYSLLAG